MGTSRSKWGMAGSRSSMGMAEDSMAGACFGGKQVRYTYMCILSDAPYTHYAHPTCKQLQMAHGVGVEAG